jgi:hypothetical protein
MPSALGSKSLCGAETPLNCLRVEQNLPAFLPRWVTSGRTRRDGVRFVPVRERRNGHDRLAPPEVKRLRKVNR